MSDKSENLKMFSLPVSDCDCFKAGEIGPDSFATPPPPAGEVPKPWPKHGVIIWYESEEAMHAAMIACTKAHW
jgi:hypothetical protein